MKPEQITSILEQAAHQLGIKVRYETMTGETLGAGGLCKMRGEWMVIMDRRATFSDRAALLMESLAGFDTDSIFLPPEIREAVVRRRAAQAPPQTATAEPEAIPEPPVPEDAIPEPPVPEDASS
jgi:hypothetical protein